MIWKAKEDTHTRSTGQSQRRMSKLSYPNPSSQRLFLFSYWVDWSGDVTGQLSFDRQTGHTTATWSIKRPRRIYKKKNFVRQRDGAAGWETAAAAADVKPTNRKMKRKRLSLVWLNIDVKMTKIEREEDGKGEPCRSTMQSKGQRLVRCPADWSGWEVEPRCVRVSVQAGCRVPAQSIWKSLAARKTLPCSVSCCLTGR